MKKNIHIYILTFILILLLSGCQTAQKEEPKPDRFEKWRVMAENSPKLTPNPRPYNEQKDRDVQQMVEELEEKNQVEAQEALQAEEALEKELPKMRLSMKMHDVSVGVLLRTLARVADVNILINETVSGQAKINIENVPWDQAFTGLLATYGLTYKWNGDILRVITVEDLEKEIALMEARQKHQRTQKEHALAMREIARKKEKLDPLITRVVKVNFADLEELRENLQKYLEANSRELALQKSAMGNTDGLKKTLTSSEFRGSILKDRNTNSLILHATGSDIRRLMPIIQKLDRPSRQVLIEAHIVEATSDTARELGIQWSGLGVTTSSDGTKRNWVGGSTSDFNSNAWDSDGNLDLGGTIVDNAISSAGGLSFGLMTEKIGEYALSAQLTALEEAGELNILSKPSITTLDHHNASIESGKDVPFQTVEDGEVNIEWRKAVISLSVTPHVINDEIVRLEILTHKDELDFTNTVDGNPTIITKNAETIVNLFNGQTTVIGGLNKENVEESESGVPVLKDLPGLGWLFRNTYKGGQMEELLIFITPHILEGKTSPFAKAEVPEDE